MNFLKTTKCDHFSDIISLIYFCVDEWQWAAWFKSKFNMRKYSWFVIAV